MEITSILIIRKRFSEGIVYCSI